MIEHYLSVVFFFSYIDGVSIFRSDIFTIATNRVMAPVIHRTEPPTVSCHSGTDTPLGRRSLVIVRERPQTVTCTYTHRRTYTAVLCTGTLQGRELLCIIHPPEQLIIKQIRKCLLSVLHNGKDENKLLLVIFNDLKKIFCNLSQIRKIK